jgi:hypothetical protein
MKVNSNKGNEMSNILIEGKFEDALKKIDDLIAFFEKTVKDLKDKNPGVKIDVFEKDILALAQARADIANAIGNKNPSSVERMKHLAGINK